MTHAMAIKKRKNKPLVLITVIFLLIYSLVVFIRSVRESLLLNARDRINIVFYGEESMIVSFGISDNVNYMITFDNRDKVTVPGGYGRYSIGALGRLTEVEKDKKIIQKSFSSMISGYVDFYVVPKKNYVYPDTTAHKNNDDPEYVRRNLIKRIFSQNEFTNIGLLDKLLATSLILRRRQQDFIFLKTYTSETQNDEIYYSEKNFLKKYKGFFYHQSLREEGEDVQIVYSTYKSAVTLSRVIEGQGIRVVDLDPNKVESPQNCTIISSEKKRSKTTFYLSQRFGCRVKRGNVEGADIIIILGRELEKSWE